MRPSRLAVLGGLLAAALALPAAPASAAIPAPPSQWYGLPGLNAASGAQWVRALAYSTPPNVVYAGLEGGGVFKSVTGGATWTPFNSGFANPLITNVRALLTSSTGTTVYAGTDLGVFKSTGGAWQPIAQGPEADPANPKKLNESVQSLVSLTGGTILAGVFNGGVFRSTDGGDTWTPPPANSGMPAIETVYGLTENIPGLVYATAGSGVYLSTNQGVTWTRVSDGIPGIASPITTWAYPERPQILFTSTGSNGIYRSVTGGLTWSAINDGLGAVRARGLQIFTAAQGAHLYAATEEGLWQALNGNSVNPPAPRWRAVTQAGLGPNEIMWSLTSPLIPGSGGLGLIAGTQSNGGYFLSFEPPDSACPDPNPSTTTSPCPVISDPTPVEAQTLTATPGSWTGTQIIEYAYQWQRCTSTSTSSCSNIADAEESSYVVPASDIGDRYRVRITATNPAPTFDVVRRYSTITGVVGANPANYPGSNQQSAPDIDVLAPGEDSGPRVGDQMYAEYGITPSLFSDGWFNPKADSISFRWLRCNSGGTDCNEIPGATSRTYTLTTADGTRSLRVRVRGTNASGTLELISPASFPIISEPAQIAAPLPPDTPGGPEKSQAPSLLGDAFVGETLAGSVGGWKDPTTDFLRRWVRCDASGAACTYLQKTGSTDPEDGATYVVRDSDVGSTIRLRVTADVNNDLTPDGLDNFLPKAVEVDTPPSAVVGFRPGSGPPPAPPGGPGGGGPDTAAPVLSAARLTKKAFTAGGKGTTFRLRLSEGGTLRIRITRAASGRKVGRACRPLTKKNRRAKRCSYQRTVTTLVRTGRPAGDVAVAFNGKVGKRRLAPGTYRAVFSVTDGAGNVSKAVTLVFRIVRR
ncbi:MAG: glycoside hydrolase [Solirubrobacteraceae bacterium]|nr:glycoside hydrolase [Solirubrobacteraceae bacterium]